MRTKILATFLCLSFSAPAQVSIYEIWWAAWHPVAAFKVRSIRRHCDHLTKVNNVRLDGLSSGGQLDAYRHVFYMAAFAQRISPRKIRKLGIAHEKGNYKMFRRGSLEDGELPDSLASVMDTLNNRIGIGIGCANRKTLLEELQRLCVDTIRNGGAYMLRRNTAGKYVDCNGREIMTEKKTWFLPKCLVSTSHH